MNFPFSKILKLVKKISTLFEKYSIFFFAGILVLLIFYAGFIFYQCVYKASKISDVGMEREKIDEELYQRVIDKLDEQEKNISEGLSKSYPDIFR